jgi:GTPase involved in cell partitioning and DNA repair
MSNSHERKPWEQFQILRKELSAYSSELESKNLIVAGNKSDLKGAFLNYEEFKKITGISPIMISAKNSEGMEELVLRMREVVLGETQSAS